MRKILTLSTALGAVMLLGGPAFAQSGQSIPSSPVAPLGAQERAAHRAGDMRHRSSTELLRESDRAVSAGNWARANELLERAQTAALNEQAMSGGTPSRGQAAGLPGFEDAKQAMMSHNRNEAHRALQQAMAGADRMGGNTATGTSSGTMPMHGGGYSGMRGGYGTPAQAQPQGGLGTPGGASPYGSAQGTETMPNAVQPGGSALGNVQGQAAGPRGAPAPGQPAPGAGGSSSQLSTGGQVRPGSPTLGGGTGGGSSKGP